MALAFTKLGVDENNWAASRQNLSTSSGLFFLTADTSGSPFSPQERRERCGEDVCACAAHDARTAEAFEAVAEP